MIKLAYRIYHDPAALRSPSDPADIRDNLDHFPRHLEYVLHGDPELRDARVVVASFDYLDESVYIGIETVGEETAVKKRLEIALNANRLLGQQLKR